MMFSDADTYRKFRRQSVRDHPPLPDRHRDRPLPSRHRRYRRLRHLRLLRRHQSRLDMLTVLTVRLVLLQGSTEGE